MAVVAPRLAAASICALTLAAVTACGASSSSQQPASSGDVSAAALTSYINAVQKIRLPVNALLGGADAILDPYHDHTISPKVAANRFSNLERQFAIYARQMQEITPPDSTLARINTPYAQTYFFEDSYLATLASDLHEGDFDNLPNTQDAQRLAIIRWRIALEVLADRLHVTLPANLQQAGRGEIAPSIEGS
jgi:hypothetical protein